MTKEELLTISHTGVIKIKGIPSACAVLKEGSRVIDSNLFTDDIVRDKELLMEFYKQDGTPMKGYNARVFTGLLGRDYISKVDKATRYNFENEKAMLPYILAEHLEPVDEWQEKIPVEFYQELLRLQGLPFYMDNIIEKERWLGRWTFQYIFNRLPKEIYFILARNLPEDTGVDYVGKAAMELEIQARLVLDRMKKAKDWPAFIKAFKEEFGRVEYSGKHVPLTEEEKAAFELQLELYATFLKKSREQKDK